MTRIRSFLTLTLCLLALGLTWAGQQSRDTVVPPPVGTAVLAGMVVTDDSNHHPVRRATVTLGGGPEVPNGRGGREAMQTMTDDQGRFLFASLPPGDFSVTASRPGFLTGFYGARRPGRGPGSAVQLAAGQKVTDLTITMTHGAAITGMILDANGRPQPDVRVNVYEYRMTNGERSLAVAASNGGSSTDDRGIYRIWGLQPGSYVIGAAPQNMGPNSALRQITADEMQLASQQLRASPAAAGPGMTAAQQPASSGAPPPGHTVTYAPVFYPGTTDPAVATPVTVAISEEKSGVDFSLALVPTARVDGTVDGPDGQQVQGVQFTMTPIQSVPLSGTNITRPSPSDRQGKFSAQNVPPGNYRLMARTQSGRGGGSPSPGIPPPPPTPPPPMIGPVAAMPIQGPAAITAASLNQDLWASIDLTVSGQDVSDVILSLRPGMTVAGRVAFEAATLTPPSDLARARVNLSPTVPNGGSNPASPSVKPDSTFQIVGVTPGKYRVGASVPSGVTGGGPNAPYWSLKSAVLNGHDLLDSSLEILPDENIQGLLLTFTDRVTDLSGALVDGDGKPAAGYMVLVITTDRSLWPAATRRIRQVHPTFDGKYRVTGLPPGEYAVGAIADTDPPDLSDVGFLDQVVAASLKITIGDGEKKVQDLRLRGGSGSLSLRLVDVR